MDTLEAFRQKNMEKILEKYSEMGVIFLTAAVTFIAIPLIFSFGDFITAAYVTAGLACIILGSFIVMFSRNESVDPRLAGILPAQGSLTLCRISSDIGIYGKAHFLPPGFTGETQVMQLNPVYDYDGANIPAGITLLKTGPRGFVTIPSCDLLIRDLKERNAMVIPDQNEALTVLLNETIGDIFEFASRVSATWNDSQVTLTLHDYLFIEGCQIVAQKSPQCCSKFPCPVCSLCGVFIAEGRNKVVTLEQCTCGTPSRDVTAVFSFN